MEASATTLDPSPFVIAVRLADEGIPVRAIARAIHQPSDDVYEALRTAIAEGSIIEMPRDDWPPGTARNSRTIVKAALLEQEEELTLACARFFKASPLEAAMLALMLRRNEVTKEQLHNVVEHNRQGHTGAANPTEPKIVDVMICKLRKKLKLHDINIGTMWGLGYLISPADRERAVSLLTGTLNG